MCASNIHDIFHFSELLVFTTICHSSHFNVIRCQIDLFLIFFQFSKGTSTNVTRFKSGTSLPPKSVHVLQTVENLHDSMFPAVENNNIDKARLSQIANVTRRCIILEVLSEYLGGLERNVNKLCFSTD